MNAEPHDANIRGAICAAPRRKAVFSRCSAKERAALCTFQKTEKDARITRVVCATDAKASGQQTFDSL